MRQLGFFKKCTVSHCNITQLQQVFLATKLAFHWVIKVFFLQVFFPCFVYVLDVLLPLFEKNKVGLHLFLVDVVGEEVSQEDSVLKGVFNPVTIQVSKTVLKFFCAGSKSQEYDPEFRHA